MSSLSDRVSTVLQTETRKALVTEEAAEVDQLSADLLQVSRHMHANTQTKYYHVYDTVVVQNLQCLVIKGSLKTCLPARPARGRRVQQLLRFQAVNTSQQTIFWLDVFVLSKTRMRRRQQRILQQPFMLFVRTALESTHDRLHACNLL